MERREFGLGAPTCLVISPDYHGGTRPDLPRLAEALADLVVAYRARGAEVLVLPTSDPRQTMEGVNGPHEGLGPLVLYVGGHGLLDKAREHFTALPMTPTSPSALNALETRTIAKLIGDSGRPVVLIVDSCFSGSATSVVAEALDALQTASKPAGFGLIASCRSYETTRDGEFLEAVIRLMRDGPRANPAFWGPNDEFIPLGPFLAELDAVGAPVSYVQLPGSLSLRALPNLQEPAEPGRVHIKLRLRRLSGGAEAHLLEKSEGFVGRVAVRRRIGEWLATSTDGMFVVTGGPGTGKSAIMGLLARQSAGDPEVRGAGAELVLPAGTFDRVVHARQKTSDEVAAELARLSASVPATILVDALDEAVSDSVVGIAARLKAVAARPGTRVIVGTRASPVVAGERGRPHPLLRELGVATVANLDDAEDTAGDLTNLLQRLLAVPPYDGLDVEELVDALVAAVTPSFLFAHAAARWLTGRDRPITEHPGWTKEVARFGTDAALGLLVSDDLAQRYPNDLQRVRDLLRAVAWAEGIGLPRYGLWPELAEMLSPTNARYGDVDVTWVLNDAGWYLTESGEDGQSVYRLFHQGFADYFREETRRGR